MLKSLTIRNIVLIEQVTIDFAKGYSVFTGETGAGKSIILDSIALIQGVRADKKIIRHGQDNASVVAEFEPNNNVKQVLQDNDINTDELIIRRTINSEGKSKCYINDTPVTAKLLAQIGELLVEVNSQHNQVYLFNEANQLTILDKFADIDLATTQATYKAWREADKQLQQKQAELEKAREQQDYLQFMLDELNELNPQADEELELAEERKRLQDNRKLVEALHSALHEVNGNYNLEGAILNAQRDLAGFTDENEGLAQAVNSLEQASIELSEAINALNHTQNELNIDPAEIDRVEGRLFAIRGLARKYDCPASELHMLKAEVEQKLNMVAGDESAIRDLRNQVQQLKQAYMDAAQTVSKQRKAKAVELQNKLLAELKPLAMGDTRFEVEFKQATPTAKGIDNICFNVATNPAIPLRPLAEIASGGEVSRLMLALKVILQSKQSVSTIIFDEIDTGTGGAVAGAIGARLADLGDKAQVIAVTHLPQVAGPAHNHYRIAKAKQAGQNITNIEPLTPAAKQEEIARMLASGEITQEAKAAASKLMEA